MRQRDGGGARTGNAGLGGCTPSREGKGVGWGGGKKWVAVMQCNIVVSKKELFLEKYEMS